MGINKENKGNKKNIDRSFEIVIIKKKQKEMAQ